ncbi:MAG: transporter associated domain-containing protein [Alphaproteobacteria bacterium]
MLKSLRQWVFSGQNEEGEGMDEGALEAFIQKLSNATTYDVYLPRADMVALRLDMTPQDILACIKERPWCVFPVTRGEIDHIYAYVRLRDLWEGMVSNPPKPLESLLQQPEYIPHTKPLLDLADQMFSQKIDMAIVVDEFGGVDGMVTTQMLMESFIETYFLSHQVSVNSPKKEENPEGNDVFLFDARTEIIDFLNFFEDRDDLVKEDIDVDVDTLAGLVFHKVARVPARGEMITISPNLDFEILDADARRVKTLRVIFKKS